MEKNRGKEFKQELIWVKKIFVRKSSYGIIHPLILKISFCFFREYRMSSDQEAKNEKRKFMRVPFKEAVRYVLEDSHEFGGCLAQDVGEGGLRLQLNDFLPMNEKVAVEFVFVGGTQPKVITRNARVAWTQRVRYADQYQVGLEFIPDHSSSESKKEVSQYIQSRLY